MAARCRSGPAARTTCSALPAHARRPTALRVEDGFLRSRGLGARLVPPLSLVQDDLGIYYDPTRESRLERLIAEAARLTPAAAEAGRAADRHADPRGITKYNLAPEPAAGPAGDREIILVPGQVEDDASILRGAGDVDTNLELLARRGACIQRGS
jgi:capsular polysaccharide export protein